MTEHVVTFEKSKGRTSSRLIYRVLLDGIYVGYVFGRFEGGSKRWWDYRLGSTLTVEDMVSAAYPSRERKQAVANLLWSLNYQKEQASG